MTFVNTKRINLFVAGKTRKEGKKKNNDDSKENHNDDRNNRKYIKIKRNHNSLDVSNWDIQSILKLYDFKDEQGKEISDLLNNDNDDDYALNDCSYNDDKQKTVFMFIITNSQTGQYLYLFTKNVIIGPLKLHKFIETISNKKFMSFADKMKTKKIDGQKLLKYVPKLMKDFGNHTSGERINLLKEITLLKKQMINNNQDTSDKDRNPKTYHTKHTRTKSEIERDRTRKQKLRKAGPRDIGKIKYHGTKYDDSKDKAFLEDSIHKAAKTENFRKRKQNNPAPKKAKVSEIGTVHNFKGIKYDDSNDPGFLADRINPLSKDEKFQKRKELHPPTPKQTVSEIGTVHNFKGMKYDDSKDAVFWRIE